MLVLLVADLESTHWLGPILAIGIAVMLAAAFTLLPALLALLGERAFWPSTESATQLRGSKPTQSVGKEPRKDSDPLRGSQSTRFVEKEPRNGWGRLADLVRRRSRAIVLGVFGLLIVLALGNLTNHATIGFGQGETRPTNSSRGTKVLGEHFPPGIGSPLTAVVEADELAPVVDGMKKLDSVKLALPVPPT